MTRKIRIYKSVPKGQRWQITDPVRSAEQGRAFVRGGYADSDAILVKTGERGDVFPYHVYTRPKKLRRG